MKKKSMRVSDNKETDFWLEARTTGIWLHGTGGIWDLLTDWRPLVGHFDVTVYELEILAKHYVEAMNDIEFWWRTSRDVSGSQMKARYFAVCRLGMIEKLLGKETLDAAIADVIAKWTRIYQLADEYEDRLSPCEKCGGKRTLSDEMQGAHCSEYYEPDDEPDDEPVGATGMSETEDAPPRHTLLVNWRKIRAKPGLGGGPGA